MLRTKSKHFALLKLLNTCYMTDGAAKDICNHRPHGFISARQAAIYGVRVTRFAS